jgi:hypothetical protein
MWGRFLFSPLSQKELYANGRLHTSYVGRAILNVAFYSHTFTVTLPPEPPHRGAHKEKYNDNLDVYYRTISRQIVLYPRSLWSFFGIFIMYSTHNLPLFSWISHCFGLLRESFRKVYSASLCSYLCMTYLQYVWWLIYKIPDISNISLTQNITATALFCVCNEWQHKLLCKQTVRRVADLYSLTTDPDPFPAFQKVYDPDRNLYVQ